MSIQGDKLICDDCKKTQTSTFLLCGECASKLREENKKLKAELAKRPKIAPTVEIM